MRPRTVSSRAASVVAAGVLALTSSGFGSADDQGAKEPAPNASRSQSATTPDGSSTATTEDDEASSADLPDETRNLVRAGQTGLKKVSDSAVYSIESEKDGGVWEVDVVTPDGTKHEMYVSRDGRSVTQAPRADGREAKYRERIQGAKLDFRQAVDAVLEEVPGARFKELGLDHEGGTIVWEVDVVDESGTARSLEIDAGNGEVLKNKIDS